MENNFSSRIKKFWDSMVMPPNNVEDLSILRQISLTAAVSLVFFLLSIPGVIASAGRRGLNHPVTISFVIVMLLAAISYVLSRTKFFRIGRLLLASSLIGYVFFTSSIRVDHQEIINTISGFVPLAFIIGAAVLSTEEISAIVIITIAGINVLAIQKGITFSEIGQIIGVLSATGALVSITNGYQKDTEKKQLDTLLKANKELESATTNLEKRVEERTEELNRRSAQLEASALVARAAAEFKNLDELIENVVQQISEKFNYYHAGIFLPDSSRQFIVLQAASSQGGKKMLARGHRLEIGRQGIVGAAAYQKRPRIAQDVGTDANYFNNPDLPDTHSEIALPLLVQNRLIGVLDIQSSDRNAFAVEDVYTLQTMADQIALAIENARLLAESQSTLDELQKLNFQNTLSTWKERLKTDKFTYVYTPLGVNKVEDYSKTDNSPGHKLAIPIRLRGQQIGQISLNRKPNEPGWSDKERELAEKVSDQIALAIDNARLLEDSQRRAAREQTINEFTGRFSRSLNVDLLLQNAVRELQRIPQVAEVSVYIKPEDNVSE